MTVVKKIVDDVDYSLVKKYNRSETKTIDQRSFYPLNAIKVKIIKYR